MRTSRQLLKQVRRALFAAFLFGGFVNLLLLALPLYTLQIFETVVPTSSVETLAILTIMAGTAILALALLEASRDRIVLRAALWLDHTLGQHLLATGLKLGHSASDIRGDAQALRTFKTALSNGTITSMFDAPWVPVFLAGLVLLHPMIGALAAAVVLAMLCLALAMSILTHRLQRETSRAYERAELWQQAVASNSGMTGALGLARGAAEQWERFNRAQISGSYSLGKRAGLIRLLTRTLRTSSQILVYGLGAWLVIRNELTPGALVACTLLLNRVIAPVEGMVSAAFSGNGIYAAYRRLRDFAADADEKATESEDGAPAGVISLRDATVAYPGRRTPALRNITLELRQGQALAIVGPNGSGKSTLAGLLAGALQPISGTAELDGLPIAKWQRIDAAPPIGYLPDDPALIEGSVHDNIARFREASLLSVAQAGMRAGVHDELIALASGYDTMIGQGGQGLALRERRAVALARALHGGPRVVVLDEPELGLDRGSVRRLIGVLERLKSEGVSLVVATQDPRLLQLADTVMVLNNGTVARHGPQNDVAAASASAAPRPVAVGIATTAQAKSTGPAVASSSGAS